MNTSTRIAVLLLPLLLASCQLLGPQRVPELQQELDAVFARSSAAVHDGGQPIPWQVGQWVLVRSESAGERTAARHQVVKEEGGGFWIETLSTSDFGVSRSAMLVMDYTHQHPERMRVVKFKLQNDDDPVTEVDEAVGDPMLVLLYATMSALEQRYERGSGVLEDVVVAAGTFRGTLKTPFTMHVNPNGTGTGTGYAWLTNAVPVLGFAKQVVDAEVLFTKIHAVEEVVDFGLTGAESHFFR